MYLLQLSCLAKKKLLQFLFFPRKELRVDCKSGSLFMRRGVRAASGRWLTGYAGSSRPEALGQSSPHFPLLMMMMSTSTALLSKVAGTLLGLTNFHHANS